jgi:hypothetical protein
MIRIHCPQCRTHLEFASPLAGQVMHCTSCRKPVRVPGETSAARIEDIPTVLPVQGIPSQVTPLSQSQGSAQSLDDLPCQQPPAGAMEECEAVGKPLCSIRLGSKFWLYFWGICGLGVIVVFLAIYGYRVSSGNWQDEQTGIFALVTGGLFLATAVVWVIAVVYQPTVLWVCSNGLMWKSGRAVDHCSWEEIAALHTSKIFVTLKLYQTIAAQGMQYNYLLKVPSGKTFLIWSGGFVHAQRVGEFIEGRLAQKLYPRFQEQFQQGLKLDFGVFQMDQTGIWYKNKQARWPEVREIVVEEGMIHVDLHNRTDWAKVYFIDVSFVSLFLTLSESMVQTFRQQRRNY